MSQIAHRADLAVESICAELLRRNGVLTAFFREEAQRLAEACREMSARFLAGGRLLAFGRGPAASDAQHVTVEFIHPVIVGKRALPAIDLGAEFAESLPVLVRPDDMVMAFGLPSAGREAERAVAAARDRGALTFGLACDSAEYAFRSPDRDALVSQEVFEVLYHVLWETVHVFFEHRELGHDVGQSTFLYPFLGRREQSLAGVVDAVRDSMMQKAGEVNRLRTAALATEAGELERTAAAVLARLKRGGKLILFGNGGSATDANDLTADCIAPPDGLSPIPAVSLSADPANLSAIANDIGSEAIFARQLIAQAQPEDVAIGITTSGGSANIIAALAEARKRGLLTVGILGYDGGRIVAERLADHALVVRSEYVPRIQEVQASLYHVLRRRIGGARDCA